MQTDASESTRPDRGVRFCRSPAHDLLAGGRARWRRAAPV